MQIIVAGDDADVANVANSIVKVIVDEKITEPPKAAQTAVLYTGKKNRMVTTPRAVDPVNPCKTTQRAHLLLSNAGTSTTT